MPRLPKIVDQLGLVGLRARGFSSRRLHLRSGSVHVLEAQGEGSLPPVVVLHGLGAAAQYYSRLLVRLRPHFSRVVAPDLPGHGHSSIPNNGLTFDTLRDGLLSVLDALVDEPVVLMGNSLGAAAAIRLANERPEKIRGLVLASPGGAPIDEARWDEFFERFAITDHGKGLEFVERIFHEPPLLKHFIALGVRATMNKPQIAELIASAEPSIFLRPEELDSLAMPTTFLWGQSDTLLEREHLAFFERHLPEHVELHRLDGVGHVPHLTHPTELTTHIVELARRC